MMKHRCITLLVLPALLLAACESKPVFTAGAGGMDMFSPTKMRLHPLSRIVNGDESSPVTVEAHIEFSDQFGDVTKSPSPLSIEVFRHQTFALHNRGERLDHQTFQLSSPDTNKKHWDPITRTYLFQLPLPADSLKNTTRLILSATLNPDAKDATRLQDDLTLTIK